MTALSGFREIILLSLLSILFINLCLQIHPISALLYDCTNTIGNHSQNSKFQSNLNTILSSISSNINTANGFYYGKAGDGVDQVNAIGYCRGDIDIETCRGCVNDAARNLTAICPNKKEAIVWLDLCMFRYSNNSILGIMSYHPAYFLVNTQNVSDGNLYPSELISFAGNLFNEAYNGSLRKFAGMKSSDSNGVNILGSLRWVLGDRKIIRFWEDDWIGNVVLKNWFPRLFKLACDKKCKVGERWCDGEWVWDWRREIRGREVGELNDLNSLISNFTINSYSGDTPWWTLNNKGKFTVKELKILIRNSEDTAPTPSHYFRWNGLIPSKINIFGWRAAQRRLPMKENLSKRGITLSTLACPMCNVDVEIELHLLVVCPLAYNVWKHVFSWCKIMDPISLNFNDLACWFKNCVQNKKNKRLWNAIFKTINWTLWCKQNDSMFNS